MSLPVQQDYFAVAVGRRTGVFKTRVAISEKNFGLQSYSKFMPPKFMPVLGKKAKICHPKIFQI